MDLKRGFIKLPRDILGSELWQTDEPYSKRDAWIYLVLNAAHEETEVFVGGRKIKLEVGQTATTYRALTEVFGWSLCKLRKWLDSLTSKDFVTVFSLKGRKGYIVITVKNFADYQGAKPERQAEKTVISAENDANYGRTFREHLSEHFETPENGYNTSVSEHAAQSERTFIFDNREHLPYNYITRNTRMCALNNNSTNYKEYYYTLPLDKRTHTVLFLGKFENVGLTLEEYEALEREYGEIDEVIDELSDAARVYPKKYGGDAYAHMLRFIRQKKRVDGASGEKKRRKLE